MSEASWIDDPETLREFLEPIRPGDVVAIDTESDHFFGYTARVALIQIATREAVALVDPVALDADDLQPLLAILEDPAVILIMHSCRNDIGELDRDYGVDIVNVFDTQLAARFAGHKKFGLSSLLKDIAGVSVSKKYQRYDWLRRPIPKGPRDYAAGDVIYLFQLREHLQGELERLGWLEAFRQQSQFIVSETAYVPSEFDPTDWRKLKGVNDDEDDQTRATLRALFTWRHELCTQLNRAALHVFENRALIKIARTRPSGLQDLRKQRGIPDDIVDEHGEDLLRVVEQSLGAKPPPNRLPYDGQRPSREERSREKALKKLRSQLTGELGLPHHLVLNRETIETMAADPPPNLAELLQVHGLLLWQAERFGDQILETLRSV